jgi:hypothetical protein
MTLSKKASSKNAFLSRTNDTEEVLEISIRVDCHCHLVRTPGFSRMPDRPSGYAGITHLDHPRLIGA